MSKNKITIITIVVTLLVILGIVFFVLNKKVGLVAEKIETKINNLLISAKQMDEDHVDYDLFKCSGSNKIVCKSDYVKVTDDDLSIHYKDIEFVIKPSVSSFVIDVNMDSDITFKPDISMDEINTKGPLNSSSEVKLMPKDSLIKVASKSNLKINDIDANNEFVVYLANDEFSKLENVMDLSKMLDNITSEEMDRMMSNTVYGFAEYKMNLESGKLLEDVINIFKPISPMKLQSKDQLVTVYEEAKGSYKELLSGMNDGSEEMKIIDDLILNLDNIILKGYNKFGFQFIKKDGVDVESIIKRMEPEDYNITFSSEK